MLALLDAITAARARGGLPALRRVRARRVDLSGDWDASFPALLGAARPDLARRDPGFGTTWTVDAPAASLAVDLAKGPLPDAVKAAAADRPSQPERPPVVPENASNDAAHDAVEALWARVWAGSPQPQAAEPQVQ